MRPESRRCLSNAYRHALAAAAEGATPGYQPGQLVPALPCRREADGQLVRVMLDEHEGRRQGAVDALLGPRYTIRGPDGHFYQSLPYPAADALRHYNPDEERTRRMAARP